MGEKTAIDEQIERNPALALELEEDFAIGQATNIIFCLMEDQDLTQRAFAERLGVPETYITKLKKNPRLTLQQFARILFALGHTVHLKAVPLRGAAAMVAHRKHGAPIAAAPKKRR